VDKDIPHRTKVMTMVHEEYRKQHQNLKLDLMVRLGLRFFFLHCTDRVHACQRALGRISLTTDLWSDPNLNSYMAITAHYMTRHLKNGSLILRSKLIAFRHMEGSHSGGNIADNFLKVIDELGIAHKVSWLSPSTSVATLMTLPFWQLGQITADNASNNNTFLESMARQLNIRGIAFDPVGNRVR